MMVLSRPGSPGGDTAAEEVLSICDVCSYLLLTSHFAFYDENLDVQEYQKQQVRDEPPLHCVV